MYKKGMQFVAIKDIGGYNTKGKIGRINIVDKLDNEYPYGIQFEEYINSKSNFFGKDGYCCWSNEKDIMPLNLKARIK